MTLRIASLAAALTLSLAAPALAQTFEGPGQGPVGAPLNAPVSAYDDITTGSIAPRVPAAPVWGVDSAKAGNANQQNFPVPQYGQTSGGPGY